MYFLLARLHRLLTRLRFKAMSRRWPLAHPIPVVGSRVVVSGFFDEALGIGRAGALTAKALERLGLSVSRDNLRHYDRGLLTRAPEVFAAGRKADIWLIHANAPETRLALMRHDVSDWAHCFRIAYWAWESDLAPLNWLDVLPWLHEIWVPSPFVMNAFASTLSRHGRIHEISKFRVMPHPLPVPELKPRTETNQKYRILTLFDPRSGLDRKNPAGAIEAWKMAFPAPSPQAELIVKSHTHAINEASYMALRTLADDRSDIKFIIETLSEDDQKRFMYGFNGIISLHRAEGFGLPIAEMMAMGRAVIATGWSGNMFFMNEENAWPVKFRLIPASRAYGGPDARWAEPDISDAAARLRDLIAHASEHNARYTKARSVISALWKPWRAWTRAIHSNSE